MVDSVKILLHVCCGPCSIMPATRLQDEGFDVTAHFFNPNIHPEDEYLRRREAMAQAAEHLGMPVLWTPERPEPPSPERWLAGLGGVLALGDRCVLCYRERLAETARRAAQGGFDGFSSSLLYSRFQRHDAIREEGERAARAAGTRFVYRDFRPDWNEGIRKSKEFGLYRQTWCGCILSRAEADAARAAKAARKSAGKTPSP